MKTTNTRPGDDLLAKARTIAENATRANRDFTDAERKQVTDLMAEAQRMRESADLMAQIDDLGLGVAQVEGLDSPGRARRRSSSPMASLTNRVIQRLGERSGHGAIANAFSVSGSVAVASDLFAEIQAKPRAMSFVGQLLGDAKALEPGEMTFLRQVTRTNNAAPVAIGEIKPTSVYELERVSAPVVTIAHVSDPIPRQHLEDADDLERFIAAEMLTGLLLAIDDQIVNGDGIEPNLAGILGTTGVQAQAFDTSPLVTTRRALTLLQTAEVVADTSDTTDLAYAINPEDWADLELTQTSTEEFTLGGPINSAERTLWGVPVVVANSVPAGQALLGKWSPGETITLGNRGGVQLSWTESVADDFSRNLVRARCEGRWGLAVAMPAVFVAVDLTAV